MGLIRVSIVIERGGVCLGTFMASTPGGTLFTQNHDMMLHDSFCNISTSPERIYNVTTYFYMNCFFSDKQRSGPAHTLSDDGDKETTHILPDS